jgi:hypothetical protein
MVLATPSKQALSASNEHCTKKELTTSKDCTLGVVVVTEQLAPMALENSALHTERAEVSTFCL